jgi:hypothetical protein
VAEGFLPGGAGTALDALLAAYPWIKLHIGAPGAAGTSNPATETTRQQASWNSTGSDGIAETSADLDWTTVAGSEDYTHCTGWSAVSGGTVGWSGTITANAVTGGDDFSIAAGDLIVSVTLAS